jgi:IstB-like ATP binding protein
MSELVTQRIQASATKLKLLHLVETVDVLIARAQEGQVGYREFLDLVLGEELGVREGRRFKQAL